MADLKKRADGRYQKSVVHPITKKRKSIYGKTKKELNQKVFEFLQEAEKTRPYDSIAWEWWAITEPNLAIQSVKSYKPALTRSISFFTNTPVDEIEIQDINRFLNTLANQNFAHRTIMNQKTVLNQIFDHAIVIGELTYNPCDRATIPRNLKKERRNAAPKSEEQIIKESPDVCLIPFIAIYTGMRKGEILALQWKDIDFEKNRIYVTKSVCHQGNKPIVKEPKTESGKRTIPLLTPLKKVLLKQKDKKSENYIISDTGEEPLTNKRYDTIYNKFREKTGVQSGVHRLRHSFATIAFECGLPDKTIQEILGHKDISTTLNIYTDFREKALEKAEELLNENFEI